MDLRIIWLGVGTFAIAAESFVISSLLPAIGADTGTTVPQAGYLVLAYALAYAFGAPILAAATGTMPRRLVLGAALLVFALGAAAAALAPGYGALLAARVVMAAMAGLYAATAVATAVAMSAPTQRARAVSLVVIGNALAVAFGAPLGAWIAAQFGWRGTYVLIAVLGVVAAAAILVMLPRGLASEKRSLRERLAVLALPGVVPALLTTLLFMVGPFAAFVYIAPLSTDGAGLDPAWMPAVLLAFGLGAAVGNGIGGQLADRIGADRTVIGTAMLNVLLLALLSAVPHLGDGIRAPAYFGLVALWGMAAWAFVPSQVSRLAGIAQGAAPLVLSLNGSAIYLGTAVGALLGGRVLEHAGAGDLGWVSALWPLAALAVIGVTRLRRAKPAAGTV